MQPAIHRKPSSADISSEVTSSEATSSEATSHDIPALAPSCPVRRAMDIIGGKWKLFIIQQLGRNVLRYGDIKRAIPDISEKMLIQELKSLVELGIVEKKSYGEVPPRVEYRLTKQGKKALPLLKHIKEFGDSLL
jgi:DNA-binding HxlR family transcriptional regulator